MLKEKISYYRKLRGYTQRQLADKMGVSTQAVGFWEQGRANPSTGKIEKLASILEITVEELMSSGEETKKEPAQRKEPAQKFGYDLPENPDLEAALRLRRERPEVTRLLANNEYSDDQIRALAAVPKTERQG